MLALEMCVGMDMLGVEDGPELFKGASGVFSIVEDHTITQKSKRRMNASSLRRNSELKIAIDCEGRDYVPPQMIALIVLS